MRTGVVRLALVAALVVSGPRVHGEPVPSTEMQEDIRALLEITGAGDMATQMMNQMVGSMKGAMPNVPEEFWTKFMAGADTEELVEMIVPIYAKYFTEDEIKELRSFYETPLGRKVISTLPAVMQESMLAGQRWGELIGQQVAAELATQGYQ